jgi:glutamate formiminotransferase
LGVVDVVPFVPLGASTMADAVAARDRFGAWLAAELGVPCFVYGTERSLPEVRRRAFHDLAPDFGPPAPHETAGAAAVGARAPLVAYNLWLEQPDLALAKAIAAELRGPSVRALGLPVGPHVQVSMNLVEPTEFGPADAFDAVSARATIARAELVGLVPRAVLDRTPHERWAQLDLADDRSIEARAAARGLSIA